MTREESWQVEGTTLSILRQIAALGYIVSVFRIPSSLLATRPGSVEMHALELAEEAPIKHVARVVEVTLAIGTIAPFVRRGLSFWASLLEAHHRCVTY